MFGKAKGAASGELCKEKAEGVRLRTVVDWVFFNNRTEQNAPGQNASPCFLCGSTFAALFIVS